MRYNALLLSAALALTLTAGAVARDRTISGLHVRPLNQDGAAVMVNAQQKSATVRELVDKLQNSDSWSTCRSRRCPQTRPSPA